ncbi:PKD domain-containing protein [Acanthopleuribacter pedis]|uniref:PKD domain-containing protein n=1 Tax=Acanthopleuribacter pedis TaxID=442870 RepID=A0A8J7QBJ5_9BACT|nr:PKD domain-containing protein [Acanthopleuribacter pedis]MBO1321084.1 PKD domain-containing protein [Acanthopleuribacter pedis]
MKNPFFTPARRRLLLPQLVGAGMLLVSCGSGAPVLDSEASLSLSAVPNTLKNNGDTTRVLVRAMVDGQPAYDGTTIWLGADRGSLPEKVTLTDGTAEVYFRSDERIGSVTLTAGRTPGGSDASETVSVIDSVVPLGEPYISYSPTNLTAAGGTVDIRVRVIGENNLPLPGETVIMSVSYGSLAPGRSAQKTDLDGWVNQTLTVPAQQQHPEEIGLTFRVRDLVIDDKLITITPNQNPKPEIHVSHATAEIGQTVVFNGAASSDPDDSRPLDPGQMEWRFGDNSAAAKGLSVEHTYTRPGTYAATLTMTDALGAAVTATKTVTVEPPEPNVAPTAVITVSPTDPRDGEEVIFNGERSGDSDGEIVAYRWLFGDGFQEEGVQVSRVYPGAGEYTATLTVEDDLGARTSTTAKVTVAGNKAPVAALKAAGEVFRPGEPVSFDASESSDPDGDALTTYSFDFGDGSSRRTQNTPTLSHSYTEQGVYLARVMVRDSRGAVDYATTTLAVTHRQPPRASFGFEPEIEVKAGTTLRFSARASTSEESRIETYEWNFGDGQPGVGVETTHTYFEAGEYSVRLTIIDEYGVRDTSAQVVRIIE